MASFIVGTVDAEKPEIQIRVIGLEPGMDETDVLRRLTEVYASCGGEIDRILHPTRAGDNSGT